MAAIDALTRPAAEQTGAFLPSARQPAAPPHPTKLAGLPGFREPPKPPLAALVQRLSAALWVGLGCGAAAAVFLGLLKGATDWRCAHPQVVFALPVLGWMLGEIWRRWGQDITHGTHLIRERLRRGGPPVPARLGPMVLLGTVLTHLGGGSVGREAGRA